MSMNAKPLRRNLIALSVTLSVLVPAAVVGTTPAQAKPAGANTTLPPPPLGPVLPGPVSPGPALPGPALPGPEPADGALSATLIASAQRFIQQRNGRFVIDPRINQTLSPEAVAAVRAAVAASNRQLTTGPTGFIKPDPSTTCPPDCGAEPGAPIKLPDLPPDLLQLVRSILNDMQHYRYERHWWGMATCMGRDSAVRIRTLLNHAGTAAWSSAGQTLTAAAKTMYVGGVVANPVLVAVAAAFVLYAEYMKWQVSSNIGQNGMCIKGTWIGGLPWVSRL